LEDLETYPWPDPKAPGRLEGLRERIHHLYYKTDYAIGATYVDNGPFEIALQLRGFEQFLVDMLLNQEFATALLRKVAEVEKGWTEEYLNVVGEYIDIMQVGDDLGTQAGPLISPALYRKILKPVHKDLFKCIKHKTTAKIWFHSDGDVAPFIPDLIDAGIDILNPIQPVGPEMDATKLKEKFGDQISFHGGIDIQHVLNQDDPEVVEQEIQTKIQALAPGGGYILASTHHLQPDTKPEMIELMFTLARKYGKYPIY
jgi:uroporphyrinogen decarboxylase